MSRTSHNLLREGPVTLIGAAVTPTTGQSWADAINDFEAAIGWPLPVRRAYDKTVPSSVAASALSHDVGQDRRVVYSIKPTISTSLSTLGSLAADLAEQGLDVDLIL